MDIYKGNLYSVIDTVKGPSVYKGNLYALIDTRISIQTYKGNLYALIDLRGREPFIPKKYPRFKISPSVFINRRR